MKFFLCYLLLVNLISAGVTLHDKQAARRHRRRVPENTLLLLSAMGGSPAMYLIMRLIHHKTLHKKFMVGIPLIFTAQVLLAALLLLKFYWKVL